MKNYLKIKAVGASVAFFLYALSPALPAQSTTVRQLTLITPSDLRFTQILDAQYPGIESIPHFKDIRPLLIFLKNDSTEQSVEAFCVEYTFTPTENAAGAPQCLSHIHDPLSRAAEQPHAIRPGDVYLFGPSFIDVSPLDYITRHQLLTQLVEVLAETLDTAGWPPLANVSVDAAVFSDGVATGPDKFHVVEKYRALCDAEWDEDEAILQMSGPGATVAGIQGAIQGHINLSEQVDLSPRDNPSIQYQAEYARRRGFEAERSLAALQNGGIAALLDRLRRNLRVHRQILLEASSSEQK